MVAAVVGLGDLQDGWWSVIAVVWVAPPRCSAGPHPPAQASAEVGSSGGDGGCGYGSGGGGCGGSGGGCETWTAT